MKLRKESAFLLLALALVIVISGIFVVRVVASNRYTQDLKKQLQDELVGFTAASDLEYAIVVEDFKKQRVFVVRNENEAFAAASLIKLPIVVIAFKAAREGKLNLADKITIEKKDVADGSGALKSMPLPQQLTFYELLEFMIARSDNTATNKVIELLGYGYINQGISQLGLKSTVLRRKMMDFNSRNRGLDNYTTASDMASLLNKIYNNEVGEVADCQAIISFLEKQKINDRIPQYLPETTKVAHKTGLERGVVHDVGIVYSPQGNYIICVLTKGVRNYKQAKDFIARLSLSVYNVYQGG